MNNENFNVASQGNHSNWESLNVSGSASISSPQGTGFNLESTMSASEGPLNAEAKLYLNPSFKPGLSPVANSVTTTPEAVNATIDQLYNFDKILQQIVQMNGTPPGSVAEEYLQELAKIPVDDPEIIAMAEKEGKSPGQTFHEVQIHGQQLFNEKLAMLPKEVADRLLFAHNNPESAKNLTPQEKTQLKTMESQVTEQLKQIYNFTGKWAGIPTDNFDLNKKISAQFDKQVETQIQTLEDSGKITKQEALQLRALHYQVADKSTANPNLVKILENIQGSVSETLRATYGADASWNPEADVAYHNAVLNGRFQAAFQTTLDNFNPPLSAATKAQVIKSFSNPDDPSIPQETKVLTQKIQATATQVVISEFGLPQTWKTTSTTAVSLNPNAQLANSSMATLKEVVGMAGEYINTLEDGPEKLSYLNYLKVIGEAIIDLQQLLYAMQSNDSMQSKDLANAKMDMAMNQIAVQQNKADEIKEKMQKMAALGPLKAMFEWIIKIIMLIIAFMLGPIMFAIVLTYIVDSTRAEVTNTTSLVQKMFNTISDKAGKGPAIAINLILTFGISMGNPLLIIQMISKDSRCFQNFVAICGGDKAAQEMVASIAGMILEMAIFFPLMILSGGGAAPMEVADAVHHALNISLTTATRLCKAASVAFQALMASLEVSRSGMQINNSVLQAQMEIIKGTADAYNEEAQATVQMLKKLIQKLLDIMNGRAEFILDLGKFQAKKYNDSSNILTELFSPEIAS